MRMALLRGEDPILRGGHCFFLWIYCIQRANSSIKERYKALKRKRAVVVDLGVNLLQKQNEMIEGMKIITGQ